MGRPPQTPFDLPLDERLCLALYRASRAMTSRYRPALAGLDLTYPQYIVMVLLWQEGPASVGRIGERLGLDSSTLSPLLKRLEAMGLIARRRDPSDERVVTVSATPAGEELRVRAADVPAQICDATGMTLADQADLVGALRELTARIESSTRAVVHD